MKKGAGMDHTPRLHDIPGMSAKEGIPVHSHIGLIPTFIHWTSSNGHWKCRTGRMTKRMTVSREAMGKTPDQPARFRQCIPG